MTSTRKSLRLGRFRAVARDILMSDREARWMRMAVDTGGLIARALERAYQEGFKDAEAALPGCEYDHAAETATLDLARETVLFVAVGTRLDARYRVVRAGPRWKGRVYVHEQTYSPRYFQILLRMGLVTAGALPNCQRTLLPISMAISAFINETERLARKAVYIASGVR